MKTVKKQKDVKGDSLQRSGSDVPVFAHKGGIELVCALLIAIGGMCPACGHGTRATSKKWAFCKKCGKRVERRKMSAVQIIHHPNARLCNEGRAGEKV